MLQLQYTSPTWMSDLLANLGRFVHGAPGDPTHANSVRWQLINLHYPLHTLTDNRTLVKALVWIITGSQILLIAAANWRRRDNRHDVLLLIGAMAAIMLTATYHRAYDAVSLLFVVAWALTAMSQPKAVRLWCAVCLAAFLSPGGALLKQVAVRGWLPPSFTTGWWWDVILLPHQAWALFFLSLTLTVLCVRRPPQALPAAS